jgi:hypothetical protein
LALIALFACRGGYQLLTAAKDGRANDMRELVEEGELINYKDEVRLALH